jgi:hypothetical protein
MSLSKILPPGTRRAGGWRAGPTGWMRKNEGRAVLALELKRGVSMSERHGRSRNGFILYGPTLA